MAFFELPCIKGVNLKITYSYVFVECVFGRMESCPINTGICIFSLSLECVEL